MSEPLAANTVHCQRAVPAQAQSQGQRVSEGKNSFTSMEKFAQNVFDGADIFRDVCCFILGAFEVHRLVLDLVPRVLVRDIERVQHSKVLEPVVEYREVLLLWICSPMQPHPTVGIHVDYFSERLEELLVLP